jgi:dolichol-phosphate mannosyltransferase
MVFTDERNRANREQITIIIPALNESDAIGKVIDELKNYGYDNIIMVDGNSSDNTVDIAKEKGARVIINETNGKTGAIMAGIKAVDTLYLLVMDGDYTYNPAFIDIMLKLAPQYDQVIGSRATGRENIPFFNRFGNRLITMAFNVLFQKNLKDVCSGMYLLRTKVAKEVRFKGKGFEVEVELASNFAATNKKIAEVDIGYRQRLGKKKLGIRHGLNITLFLLREAMKNNLTLFF